MDILFNKLKNFQIDSNIFIDEVLYKNQNFNNLNIKFNKTKNIVFDLEFDNKFLKSFKAKSKLYKNKNILISSSINNINLQNFNSYTKYSLLSGELDLYFN